MIRKRNMKTRTARYEDKPEYEDTFPDKPYSEGKIRDHISAKAMRDLPKSSYSIKADPYTASLPASTPYNILAPFLKPVGGRYDGEDNIDGGNVKQYANSSTSKFLKYFDSFRTRVLLNYRYLPIKTMGGATDVIGERLVDEMRKAIAEAISVLNSTTYTSLAVNNFAIVTDLNMGSATGSQRDISPDQDGSIMAYTNQTDVMYALSIYYQIVLQEALSVMNAHNSFRLKEGTAIRDAWGREVPVLNSFFGLMNKNSFINLLNSINLSFEGEYIDTDFMTQVNMLTLMPSRRSNSLTDPTLELEAMFDHPTFEVYVLDSNGRAVSSTPFFQDSDLSVTVTIEGQTQTVSFWQACAELKDLLTLESTKYWARGVYTTQGIIGTDNARFNTIKTMFDVITQCFVIFKPKFSDYRQCLDTMTRTGTISWTKGFRPSVTKDTDAQLYQNLIVDDVYKMIMSGNDTLQYNTDTKRWQTFSQWNIYTGIPEYDLKQGGAFITFSAKELSNLVSNEEIEYLPIMFTPIVDSDGIYMYGVSREGKRCYLDYSIETMSSNSVLERLAPLTSQASLQIRVPSISIANNTHTVDGVTITLDSAEKSTLYKTLTQVFGMCSVEFTAGTFDYAVDPDILAIYQIEISDITNIAITYARANAPFKGTTSSEGLLGFFGTRK